MPAARNCAPHGGRGMDDLKRRATVHDVARKAGVSLATVDRVLNARPGVRVETAEKVAEAIRVLDFRRDVSASLLARARDLSVTFLIKTPKPLRLVSHDK